MKINIKRLSALFIVLVLLLSTGSCADKSVEQTSNKPEISNKINRKDDGDIEIVINVPIMNNPKRDPNQLGNRVKYDDLSGWYEYIEDKFGTDITIKYIDMIHAYNVTNGSYFIDRIKEGEVSGLIRIDEGYHNSMIKLKDKNAIIPLDDLFADNKIFALIPDEMKNAYRLPDGNIWALPAGYSDDLYTRFYNKKWMETLNLDVPESLDEFYEVVHSITYDDPNKNNKKDEIGIVGKYNTNLGAGDWDELYNDGPTIFGDVFLAFECYLSGKGFASAIGYDYSTKAYEDAVLKPEMKNALNYIKRLMDEGIVVMSSEFSAMNEETTGSFHRLNDFQYDNEKWLTSYSLTPEKEFSVMGLKPKSCYVLAANTENPKQTIEKFLETFYSDISGVLAGQYGVENKNYTLDDKTLKMMDKPFINILDEMAYIEYNYIDTFSDKAFDDHSLDADYSKYQIYSELASNNKLISSIDLFPHLTTQSKYTSQLNRYFTGVFTQKLVDYNIDSMSTEDFMNNYLNSMRKSGAQEILDDLNEAAGTTATYSYGN